MASTMKPLRLCNVARQALHPPHVRIGPRATSIRARWSSTTTARKWSTPLAKTLGEAIQTTGPISLATYMRHCLTSTLGGYYGSDTDIPASQNPSTPDPEKGSGETSELIGKKGDFVTSPEISQVFGELVGIWLVTQWMSQGRRGSGIQLIELGPGRGTLMDDVLRTIGQFPAFLKSIDTVYLVESSPTLREMQQRLLCEREMQATETGWTAKGKFGGEVHWMESLGDVPRDPDSMPLMIAHEFFDALPIHAFQSVRVPSNPTTGDAREEPTMVNEWRELLVSPTPPPSLLSPTPNEKDGSKDQLDFQLSLSKTPTKHSRLLPQLSPRYTALQSTTDAVIEISPDSLSTVAEMAVRIGGTAATPNTKHSPSFPKKVPAGAALIIDYGPLDTIPTNSLRGIREHQMVSPFSTPGRTDLSADVDFLALAHSAIDASEGVEVHGPVEQGFFLQSMGGGQRVEQLLASASASSVSDEEGNRDMKERVEMGWKRLIERGPQGMGRIYKALAIVPHVPVREGEGKRRPVGFGGDLPR